MAEAQAFVLSCAQLQYAKLTARTLWPQVCLPVYLSLHKIANRPAQTYCGDAHYKQSADNYIIPRQGLKYQPICDLY